MLGEDIDKEIDQELARHERRGAAIVEVLKIVQRHRGWVSDDSVAEVAEAMGMSTEEVDSIATFYTAIYRRPVGRHVILLCDSVSCWIMGQESLQDHLCGLLRIAPGETTADGRFTLLPVACLGACDLAPAMMVDEDLHGLLSPAKIDEILRKYH